MAVAASTIFARVRSMLDDDNSNRYTEAKDLIPAINSAIGYVTALFSFAFEQKKIQPEALAELTIVLILEPDVTGGTARVNLNRHDFITPYSEMVWTIFGVDPNPSYGDLQGIPGAPDALTETLSRFAKRLTLKEWNYAPEDPFTPGTGQDIPTDFQRTCYTGPGDYLADGDPYIFIRPGSLFTAATSRVGIWCLKKHVDITAGADDILFPPAVISMIEQKTLQYVTYQQGDPRLFQITDKEVKELITLMN